MSNRFAWSLLTVVAIAAALAQSQPAEFEVASIRPNIANDRIVTIAVGPGDRFTARGYTLVLLIQRAYGVMDWNLTGGPGWIRNDRWDVVAKANTSGSLTEEMLQPMLQRLLADRFKLRLHKGSKEMAGHALVVARGGPKVKASLDGAEHRDSFRMRGGEISGQGITMKDLARVVGGKLGLIVADKTGLSGVYDFKVHYTEETEADNAREEVRSAVFAALQDLLGLKITPQRINVELLVIDSVERASEN